MRGLDNCYNIVRFRKTVGQGSKLGHEPFLLGSKRKSPVLASVVKPGAVKLIQGSCCKPQTWRKYASEHTIDMVTLCDMVWKVSHCHWLACISCYSNCYLDTGSVTGIVGNGHSCGERWDGESDIRMSLQYFEVGLFGAESVAITPWRRVPETKYFE